MAIGLGIFSSPATVEERYLCCLHAQEYAHVYRFISTAGMAYKSREECAREQIRFTGFSGAVIHQLASYIKYKDTQVNSTRKQAVVTARLIVPDSNTEAIDQILFAGCSGEGTLPESEQEILLQELAQLFATG